MRMFRVPKQRPVAQSMASVVRLLSIAEAGVNQNFPTMTMHVMPTVWERSVCLEHMILVMKQRE